MNVRILGAALLAALGTSVSHSALADSPTESFQPGDSVNVVDTSPASITTTGKFQRLIQLKDAGSSTVYRHRLDLPAGAHVRGTGDEAGARNLSSDLEVVDGRGRTLGTIDSAWAQDATGQPLPSYFRIEGDTLVQVVDASKAVGEVTALLQYTGASAELAPAGAMVEAYVGIPSNYVYNLNHPRKTLHDYCTKSPDEFPNPIGANANFRGPCARHDMCFELKQASQYTCNNRLWSDMRSNCAHTYAWYNPTRDACYSTANVYWAAVTANTIWP